MDPILPITSGPPAVSRTERPPVERLERISRERDRPKDPRERRRREAAQSRESEHDGPDDDGPASRIDVRA